MAEHPNDICVWFYLEHRKGLTAIQMFDTFWNETPQEPECTVLNVKRLNLHFEKLDRIYKQIRKAYDQMAATGDADEIAMHGPECEAFCDRYKKIKDIQTRPEWNINKVYEQTSPSEWKAASQKLWSAIRPELRAAYPDYGFSQ